MKKTDIILSDGRTITVRPTLLDKVAAETYFRVNPRLGGIGDNPIRFMAVCSWAAAKREKLVDVDFDQFLEGGDADLVHAVDLDTVDDIAPTVASEEVEGLGEDTLADLLTS